jgi:hypothetical protein
MNSFSSLIIYDTSSIFRLVPPNGIAWFLDSKKMAEKNEQISITRECSLFLKYKQV